MRGLRLWRCSFQRPRELVVLSQPGQSMTNVAGMLEGAKLYCAGEVIRGLGEAAESPVVNGRGDAQRMRGVDEVVCLHVLPCPINYVGGKGKKL